MKALLINPLAKAVIEVDIGGNDNENLERIYELMGADLVDTVRISHAHDGEPGAVILVDDMGTFRKPLYCDDIFKYQGYPIPLIGKAVVIGNDAGGETVDCPIGVEELVEKVKFAPAFCPENDYDCEYRQAEA